MIRERIYENPSRGISKVEEIEIPSRPLPGEVTEITQIREGKNYKLTTVSGSLSRTVTVLKGPHLLEDRRRQGLFITLGLNYTEEEKRKIKISFSQETVTWPVYMFGIKQRRIRRFETSLCLVDPDAQ